MTNLWRNVHYSLKVAAAPYHRRRHLYCYTDTTQLCAAY